jgi:hypothetical protein
MRDGRRVLIFALCGLIVASLASSGMAEDDANPAFEKSESTGPYFRGAFSIGVPGGAPRAPTLFGLTLTGGYQFMPFVGTEIEISWVGGSGRFSAFAAIWNGRVYPLALFGKTREFPVQPYALLGIGGGDMHNGPGSSHFGSFIVNLGMGADWMLGDRFGLYTEVAERFYTRGRPFNGVTAFNFGAVFRF